MLAATRVCRHQCLRLKCCVQMATVGGAAESSTISSALRRVHYSAISTSASTRVPKKGGLAKKTADVAVSEVTVKTEAVGEVGVWSLRLNLENAWLSCELHHAADQRTAINLCFFSTPKCAH